MITALIPAHNEAAGIAQTLEGLKSQTTPAERIIVVADNCTDDTVSIAKSLGAEVFETVGNKHKKAGALNQALSEILPTLSENDFILVQDADTRLSPEFFSIAISRFENSPHIGAVGGSFFPKDEPNLLAVMQGNEYSRYVREISRRREAKANVLTGAGSIFRVSVMNEIYEARESGVLPGKGVYKQDALTEDNELTLAIKTLGYKVVSPKKCEIHTDVPIDIRSLYEQRLRWRRGALEDLKSYGLTRVTAPYIGKLVWSLVATSASALYLLLLALIIAAGVPLTLSVFWVGVFVVYWLDRIWTLNGRSAGNKIVAATMIPEILYDSFQQIVMLAAIVAFIFRTDQRWVHAPSV